MNRKTVAALAAVGTAAAAASVPYFHRQNTEVTAAHYTFRSAKVKGALEGFRITQISDLHNREFGRDNCRLLALTEAQLPDLLVITGDLMDSYHTDLDRALNSAGRLARIAPCYYVTGNHEQRMSLRRQTEFYRALAAAGVVVLRNEAVTLGMGESFRLNMQVAAAQFDAIRSLAEKGNSIFVGRCADYVLRNREDLLRVFIQAEEELRTQEMMQRRSLTEEQARKLIRQVDKDRSSYYRYYTDQSWGERAYYDLCINSGKVGVSGAVQIIKACLQTMENKSCVSRPWGFRPTGAQAVDQVSPA